MINTTPLKKKEHQIDVRCTGCWQKLTLSTAKVLKIRCVFCDQNGKVMGRDYKLIPTTVRRQIYDINNSSYDIGHWSERR